MTLVTVCIKISHMTHFGRFSAKNACHDKAKIEANWANRCICNVSKEAIFIQLSDKIKKFSVGQAIDYLNRNPVKNLPTLLDRADTFCAG